MTLAYYRRAARPEDAFGILCTYRDSLRDADPQPYPEATLDAMAPAAIPPAWLHWLTGRIRRGSEETVVVFAHDGALAGFGSVLPRRSLLQAVYVAPAHQRRGVGAMILEAAERMAAVGGTAVLSTHAPPSAEGFFAGAGYVAVGRGRQPVGGGLDLPATIMVKPLGAVASFAALAAAGA